RDPKVGGGVGRIREVAKNRTPILIKQHFGSSYVATLWLKLCSKTLAQVMKQYFGSSYVAMLWLKLCSNTLAQVMKQYFGSSYVAMLWLKLCSNTLVQVMKQYFGSSYVAMLWLKLCSNTLAQVMKQYFGSSYVAMLWLKLCSNTLAQCNKCGRLHYGSTCPGKGNGCFHCKEFGHIKRYCPKLDRRPNVMHAGEARDHGRMVTPSGAGTSGVDDPARGKRMVTESGCGKSADRVVAVGDMCKVSDQASGIGPMSAKKVRSLIRKRDRYSFSKCHKRNLYHSVDMRNDVLAGFNPGNGLARDPKVGGGVGRIREVAKNRTPILIKQHFGSSYVATLWLKLCIKTLAQVMKQYFGSSYVAMLWLKLCSNTLAQVMKQYFGSSYVAMLWLKLCSNTLAQVMKQYFGSSYVAMLWLKLCSNTLAQVMKQYFGSSYVAMLWLKLCSNTLAQVM
ncbi:hypothetical protein Lal_00031481, partial [Lupinus albus]